jgi:hypothetical protein
MICNSKETAAHQDCKSCENESSCDASRLMNNWDRLFFILIIGINLYVLYIIGLAIILR